MLDLTKQRKINFFGIIILTILLLVLFFWQVFLNAAPEQENSDLNLAKYKSATARISQLENSYKNSIFSNQLFLSLKSVFKLPLEVGAVGKENPFLLPLPPEIKTLGN